ncbi:MAG: ATP-binding protein [Eubacteriales bacterium]|nr:ATP-binding protein [Eubacteriales bacterium]
MAKKVEKIELALPFKAEYVSVARLTASGIAARMGFDIESVEDIKVALSEVCNKLVSAGSKSSDRYVIDFIIHSSKIEILINFEDRRLAGLFGTNGDELGISIIEALMDTFKVSTDDSNTLSMSKEIKGKI